MLQGVLLVFVLAFILVALGYLFGIGFWLARETVTVVEHPYEEDSFDD